MFQKSLLTFVLMLSLLGCAKKSTDDSTTSYSVDNTVEVGQQVGEVTASVDESGGSSNGSIAMIDIESAQRSLARYQGKSNDHIVSTKISEYLLPKAHAADCSTIAFGSCGASVTNARVKNFNSCTIGIGATLTGSVQLVFAGTGAASCTLPSNADSVTRTPNFTITGARGATFQVTASGAGQTVTRTGASAYTFAHTGIRRVFTTPAGNTLLDVTTSTTSNVTFTGNSRSGRALTGGTIQVANNLTGITCSLTPSSVTWGSASCNCPTSGSFSGTCTSGAAISVTFSSTCGQSTTTIGSDTKTVTLDRCNL